MHCRLPTTHRTWKPLAAAVVAGLLLAGWAAAADAQQAPEKSNPGAAAFFRGMKLMKAGLVDGAIAAFSELVRYDPDDPVSYCYRANALLRKSAWDQAIADASKAIELDEKQAWAYVLRGYARSAKNLNDEALADFNRAVVLDAALADAYVQRGHLYAKLGQAEKANADLQVANRLLVEQAGPRR